MDAKEKCRVIEGMIAELQRDMLAAIEKMPDVGRSMQRTLP
jgi:hypothetical protein